MFNVVAQHIQICVTFTVITIIWFCMAFMNWWSVKIHPSSFLLNSHTSGCCSLHSFQLPFPVSALACLFSVVHPRCICLCCKEDEWKSVDGRIEQKGGKQKQWIETTAPRRLQWALSSSLENPRYCQRVQLEISIFHLSEIKVFPPWL